MEVMPIDDAIANNIEKATKGNVWFKNTFLPILENQVFTAKQLVDGMRCGKVALYNYLPSEVLAAVYDEERKQFSTNKQPIK